MKVALHYKDESFADYYVYSYVIITSPETVYNSLFFVLTIWGACGDDNVIATYHVVWHFAISLTRPVVGHMGYVI